MDGTRLIAAERARQESRKGYLRDHDDQHTSFEMTRSAVAYALHASGRLDADQHWPFGSCEWKPSVGDPVRDLTKAGALIAAEIDRLLRLGGVRAESAPVDQQETERLKQDNARFDQELRDTLAAMKAQFDKRLEAELSVSRKNHIDANERNMQSIQRAEAAEAELTRLRAPVHHDRQHPDEADEKRAFDNGSPRIQTQETP